jgi:putative two-component system response regulator
MHIVKCRVDNHIRLKRYQNHLLELAEKQAQKILSMRESIYDAVTSIIEYRSLESGRHVKRIRMFCEAQLDFLCKNGIYTAELDQHTAEMIARASSLHDIGKVSIPDRILTKPGPLTSEEMEIMKTHSEIGSRFIDSLADYDDELFVRYARQICRHHHEHWDGKGYPDGLKGHQIPLSARVVAVADVYDALVSPRVYKPAYSHEKATQILMEEKGKLFDPTLIDVYTQIEDSFVEISKKHGDEVRQ